MSDGVIYTNAGPEISVASTKAYTAQICALYLLSRFILGDLHGLHRRRTHEAPSGQTERNRQL